MSRQVTLAGQAPAGQPTPGPWRMAASLRGRTIVESSSVNSRVCEMARPHLLDGWPAEMDANARLIAASPTLYAYVAAKAAEGDADAARIISSI